MSNGQRDEGVGGRRGGLAEDIHAGLNLGVVSPEIVFTSSGMHYVIPGAVQRDSEEEDPGLSSGSHGELLGRGEAAAGTGEGPGQGVT